MSVKLCTRCTTRCLKHEIRARNNTIYGVLNVTSFFAVLLGWSANSALLITTWFVTGLPFLIYVGHKDVEWEEACKVKKD